MRVGGIIVQQLSFNFDIWFSKLNDLVLFPEGTYIHLYHINVENRVIDGLYKVIKHCKDSVEVLYHYKYDKDSWTFTTTLIKHSKIVKFKGWN